MRRVDSETTQVKQPALFASPVEASATRFTQPALLEKRKGDTRKALVDEETRGHNFGLYTQ